MVACSILNCRTRSVKNGSIRFYTFPKARPKQANAWLRLCKPKTTPKYGRVCSLHFKPSDYDIPLQYSLLNIPIPKTRRFLKPEAVPSIHLEQPENTPRKSELKNNIENEVYEETIDVKTCDPDEYYTIPANDVVFVQSLDTIQQSEDCSTVAAKSEYDDHSYCQSDASVNDAVGESIPPTLITDADVQNGSSLNLAVERCVEGITITKTEYKKLVQAAKECNILKKNLKTVFTRGQIRCLMKVGKRRVRWCEEDINAAFSLLQNAGPKAYYHLKTSVGMPLPSFSTLRKWTAAADKKMMVND